MRAVAYLIIILGVLLLADAAYDEHRGIAEAKAPGPLLAQSAKKSDDSKQFQSLMFYQWVRAGLVMGAGFAILGFVRRTSRLDPFSGAFAGSAALDDLTRALDKEQENTKAFEEMGDKRQTVSA